MTKKATKHNAAKKAVAAKKKPKRVSRRERFVEQYLVDLNATKAAIRAGFKPTSARFEASKLMAEPAVQAAIEAAMQARADRTQITTDKVLERLWGIATADASELIELRRCCCRYCYGKKFLYQRTPREMRDAIAQYQRDVLLAKAKGEPVMAEFNAAGGTGFDPRKDPNPDCPECFGEGVERVFPKDTRDLSPNAKLLYAGVRTTQHGLEIKTHDQTAMLVKCGEHLGIFKRRIEHTGKDGKDLPTGVVIVPAKRPEDDAAPAPEEVGVIPIDLETPTPVDPKKLAVKSAS